VGKGTVNKTHPTFGGVYAGDGSQTDVEKRVEASDLILTIGAIKVNSRTVKASNVLTMIQSDFNTAGFTYKASQLNTIDFHSIHPTVRYSEYPGVAMQGVLRKIIQQVDVSKLSSVPGPETENKVEDNVENSEAITQK
jgi:pyruvate decarboxylase